MVLLLVDAQAMLMNSALYGFEDFKTNVSRLIGAARESGIEVIYVRHEDNTENGLLRGTPGFEIYEGFAPVKGERIFDKNVNSPFKSSGLLEYLREKKTGEIIVAGLQTDYCIDATVKCGFEHGFHVIVPEKANSTFGNQFMNGEQLYRYYNEFMWNGRYADCMTMEQTLALMKRYAAGTD